MDDTARQTLKERFQRQFQQLRERQPERDTGRETPAGLEGRMRGNMTKMDMALWERDAARGGVDHANRLAEHSYEARQEVRNGAIARNMTADERDTYRQDEARAQAKLADRSQQRDTGRETTERPRETVKERFNREIEAAKQVASRAPDEWERNAGEYYAVKDSRLTQQRERLGELSHNATSKARELQRQAQEPTEREYQGRLAEIRGRPQREPLRDQIQRQIREARERPQERATGRGR